MFAKTRRLLGYGLAGALISVFVGPGVFSASAQGAPTCFDVPATIVATGAVTNGTNKADVIYVPAEIVTTVNAQGGNDLICSDNPDSTLHGGPGNDWIEGLGAFYGDAGADQLVDEAWSQGVDGPTAMIGGTGNDRIFANQAGYVDGGSGNDVIYVEVASEVHGGSGNDSIQVGSGTSVFGESGSDSIGVTNAELIDCGSGIDYIYVGDQADSVVHCERDLVL